jgi:hypothetical protein
MGRQVDLSERGDGKNDGLTPDTPVFTGSHAVNVSQSKRNRLSYHWQRCLRQKHQCGTLPISRRVAHQASLGSQAFPSAG